MNEKNRELLIQEIVIICDIAIEAFILFPPKDFNQRQLDFAVKVYKRYALTVIGNERKLPMHELKDIKNDVLAYFHEASGKMVEFFWKEIQSRKLNITRVNKLERMLKKKKISSQVDYDYITDMLVAAEQEGAITKEQAYKLGSMADAYMLRK